ncbi:MAG: hypothetical protein QNJ26_17490 [Desulfobacterales bacterium]|nr:hypothetical protein [Desulfobacterales bacterium]
MKKMLMILAIVGLTGLIFSGPSWAGNYQQRLKQQQKKIWKGFNKGQLTRHETRQLIREQRKIRQHLRSYASDGQLSRKEKKRINRWLHKSNRHIRRLKQNENERNRRWNTQRFWWLRQHYGRQADRDLWHIW